MFTPIIMDVRVKIPHKDYDDCMLKGYFYHKGCKVWLLMNENKEKFFMTSERLSSEMEEVKKEFEKLSGALLEKRDDDGYQTSKL